VTIKKNQKRSIDEISQSIENSTSSDDNTVHLDNSFIEEPKESKSNYDYVNEISNIYPDTLTMRL